MLQEFKDMDLCISALALELHEDVYCDVALKWNRYKATRAPESHKCSNEACVKQSDGICHLRTYPCIKVKYNEKDG